MASQYIEISSGTRVSSLLRRIVDEARTMQEDTTELVGICEQIKFGDDWPALCAQFGFPVDETVKVQAVYALVLAFQNVINKAAFDAFINRLG